MRVFGQWWMWLGLLLAGFFLAACDEDGPCMAGTKNCTCYSTGNCRGELMCIAGVCRAETTDSAVAPLVCEEECNDNIGCTDDDCVQGMCAHVPNNDRCNDGQSCDLLSRACVDGATCSDDDDCEDEEICTERERCQPSTRTCVFDVLDGDGDGVPPEVCGGSDPNDGDPDIFSGGEGMVRDDGDAG